MPVYISLTLNESSFAAHPVSALDFGVSVLDYSHSNSCVVVYYCFNLHFLDKIWCGATFSMIICHLYNFFPLNLIFLFFKIN